MYSFNFASCGPLKLKLCSLKWYQNLILLKMSLVPCFVGVHRTFYLDQLAQMNQKPIVFIMQFLDQVLSVYCFACCQYSLRGYCTPDQKLACFVLYLKIINTSLKNNICIIISADYYYHVGYCPRNSKTASKFR